MKEKRSFNEVFDDHLKLSEVGDFESDFKRNFSPDIVVLTGFGVFRGYQGVRKLAVQLENELPKARYHHKTKIVDEEMAFLEWTAISNENEVTDGVDSYLFKEGKIVAQTIHYTVRKRTFT